MVEGYKNVSQFFDHAIFYIFKYLLNLDKLIINWIAYTMAF